MKLGLELKKLVIFLNFIQINTINKMIKNYFKAILVILSIFSFFGLLDLSFDLIDAKSTLLFLLGLTLMALTFITPVFLVINYIKKKKQTKTNSYEKTDNETN
jgi:hypothetical protein